MSKIKFVWIFSGVLLALNIVVYLTRWGGDDFLKVFSDSLPVVCSLISSICLFYAYRGFKGTDFARLPWLMIFLGITLDFIAETTYCYMEVILKLDMNETFPSIADYIWCAGYIPLFIGLMMMISGYRESGFPVGSKNLYTAITAALVVFLILITWILFVPIVCDNETSTLETTFYLFYPVADVVVVIPAIVLMSITSLFGKGMISRSWKYLSIGLILFTLADLAYSYLSWKDLYGDGNLIDLAWHAGYLIIGLAGLNQRELIKSFNGEPAR